MIKQDPVEHEDVLDVLAETVGPFDENSYFLVDRRSKDAVAIDPGDEPGRLLEVIRKHGLSIRYILNTHGHIDHVLAISAIKSATGAPFYIHPADCFLLEGLSAQAAYFDLPPPDVPEVDGYLSHGQIFQLGRSGIEVIETPGHSPGGVTFKAGDLLFVGDALFSGSIGRTDLPGGDMEILLESIRERLLSLPEESKVYPGHGPPTTIGREKRTNPFLR